MLLTNRIVIIGKYFYWWLICVRHWALYKHDRIAIDKQLKFSYKQYYFISLLRKRLSTIRVLNSNRYIKWKLDNQAIKISCAFSKRNESTGVAFRKTFLLFSQTNGSGLLCFINHMFFIVWHGVIVNTLAQLV